MHRSLTRGIHDRFDSLWGGWMVRTSAGATQPFSFFFAGDTGYSRDFKDIAAKFGSVDVALLPIGAYPPRWFMKSQHIDADDAIKVHRDLKARQSIAIHCAPSSWPMTPSTSCLPCWRARCSRPACRLRTSAS